MTVDRTPESRDFTREELIEKFEELRPEIAKLMRQFGAHEPDWEPLERVLCGDFMFMGYCQGVRMYKHRFTRQYLHLDEEGRAYRWDGVRNRYDQIPVEEAIADAFANAEELMGWLRDRNSEALGGGR